MIHVVLADISGKGREVVLRCLGRCAFPPATGSVMTRENWSREELIVAFNLYCKTPFGRIHIRNPEIVQLAKAVSRTPSAVSWKLANFARLDPSLRSRHIAGATHGSKLDREVWEEFSGNWDELAFQSEQLLAKATGRALGEVAGEFPEGASPKALVRVRVNQKFFRSAVLAAYDSRCCITGLDMPSLLNASHIVPWATDSKNRTNPRNGLCLNAIHDRAFDCGYVTVSPDYVVRHSPLIRRHRSEPVKQFFLRYEGRKIRLPGRFLPDPAFLRYHNDEIFCRTA